MSSKHEIEEEEEEEVFMGRVIFFDPSDVTLPVGSGDRPILPRKITDNYEKVIPRFFYFGHVEKMTGRKNLPLKHFNFNNVVIDAISEGVRRINDNTYIIIHKREDREKVKSGIIEYAKDNKMDGIKLNTRSIGISNRTDGYNFFYYDDNEYVIKGYNNEMNLIKDAYHRGSQNELEKLLEGISHNIAFSISDIVRKQGEKSAKEFIKQNPIDTNPFQNNLLNEIEIMKNNILRKEEELKHERERIHSIDQNRQKEFIDELNKKEAEIQSLRQTMIQARDYVFNVTNEMISMRSQIEVMKQQFEHIKYENEHIKRENEYLKNENNHFKMISEKMMSEGKTLENKLNEILVKYNEMEKSKDLNIQKIGEENNAIISSLIEQQHKLQEQLAEINHDYLKLIEEKNRKEIDIQKESENVADVQVKDRVFKLSLDSSGEGDIEMEVTENDDNLGGGDGNENDSNPNSFNDPDSKLENENEPDPDPDPEDSSDGEKSNTYNSDSMGDNDDDYFRNKRLFTMGLRVLPTSWRHPAQNEIFYDKKKFNRFKNLRPHWEKFSEVDKRKEWAKEFFWRDDVHKKFYIR